MKRPAATKRDRAVRELPLHEKLRWSWPETCAAVGLCETKVRAMIRRGEFPPPVELEGRQQFLPGEVRAWADCEPWRSLVSLRLEAPTHA